VSAATASALKRLTCRSSRQQVAALGEEVVHAAAAELQSAGPVLHAEGHLRRLHAHAQLAEEAGEVRVSDLVIDHEAGVEGDVAGAFGDGDGVGVAAGVVRLLEEREVEAGLKEVRAAQAGDAGADDGEAGHAGRKPKDSGRTKIGEKKPLAFLSCWESAPLENGKRMGAGESG
jgi:hypothetical protein